MPVTTDVTDLAAKFQRATAELKITGTSRDELHREMTRAASPLGATIYIGTIFAVGGDSTGGNQVQFSDPATNTSYSSAWPQWGFDLAQAALLAGKEVMLVASGEPFGSNLFNVLIFA
jgi:hypothetical protein